MEFTREETIQLLDLYEMVDNCSEERQFWMVGKIFGTLAQKLCRFKSFKLSGVFQQQIDLSRALINRHLEDLAEVGTEMIDLIEANSQLREDLKGARENGSRLARLLGVSISGMTHEERVNAVFDKVEKLANLERAIGSLK